MGVEVKVRGDMASEDGGEGEGEEDEATQGGPGGDRKPPPLPPPAQTPAPMLVLVLLLVAAVKAPLQRRCSIAGPSSHIKTSNSNPTLHASISLLSL